jgi:fermentation-respiration switch protein FrsA (DUF1100 family)
MKKLLLYFFSFITISLCILSCSTASFFYAPTKLLKDVPDTALYNYEQISFKGGNDKMLQGWSFHPDTAVIGTVVQLHGNGGNISYQYQFAKPLIDAGFQVLVFDYEGYGNSEGTPSQENVLNDGISALRYARSREDIKNTKLILFGQSLGGHLSCVVAAKEQKLIDALVIEDAFSGHDLMAAHVGGKYHVPAWFAKMIVRTEYEGIEYIDEVSVPKLIIHSTEDRVCPFYMGQDLYNAAASPKEFWQIKGGHIQASMLYPEEFAKRFRKIIGR